VKGTLHHILQREIGPLEQRQEVRHIERRVDSTDQLRPGLARVEVEAAVARGFHDLYPQSFPTSPACSAALRGIGPGLAGASVPIGMQVHAHRLLRDLYPCALA
jgi:hypothetical protein